MYLSKVNIRAIQKYLKAIEEAKFDHMIYLDRVRAIKRQSDYFGGFVAGIMVERRDEALESRNQNLALARKYRNTLKGE